MATVEPIDLREARQELLDSRVTRTAELFSHGRRTLTSESTMQALGAGGASLPGFAAAKLGRLNADWAAVSRSSDQDLMVDLRRLRARAREQAINSPIATKFLGMVRSNVIGKHGIKLAFKVPAIRKTAKRPLDEDVNAELDRGFIDWGRKGSCTVCGRYSWPALQRLIVENCARDGEQFLRKVFVPKTVNPYGFQLQVIDADQVDDTYNLLGRADGVQIRMGVEVDANQKPLAYHIFQGNPFEVVYGSSNRVRVPADQIIHYYVAHRTGQTRGYPWFATSMSQLRMLDGFFYAELTAARMSASLLASIETTTNPEFQGDGNNADGTTATDIGYGTIIGLGPNQSLKNNTPQHPSTAFGEFVKGSNRIIASGMNVAYHKLANDLAGINYSSGRLGELEEREHWMEMQAQFIDDVADPVYETWQKMAQLNGALDVPFDLKRYLGRSLKWEPRRWPWVDPLKDVQASTLLVQNGFETHESILNSQGRDLQATYTQLKAEQDLADDLGIVVGTDIRGQATSEENDGPPAGDGEGTDADGNEKAPAVVKPGKPAKPSARPSAAPGKAKVKARADLVRGVRPENAALFETEERE